MALFDRIRPTQRYSMAVVATFVDTALAIRQWRTFAAERHVRAGRIEAAEAAFRRIITNNPAEKAALAGLGRLLLRERRFGEAVEVWQALVALEPNRPNPTFQLARALHRSGRFEDAASQYLRVVALDPLHEKAYEALDQLTDRLLRPGTGSATAVDTASLIAQQVLTLKSGSPKLQAKALGLMAALRSRIDPEAAADFWRRLVDVSPRAIEPRLQLARHHLKAGRNDEAMRYFRAVLDLEPNHVEALLSCGQMIEATDQVAAIRHFSEWARRQPKDAAPRLELARLYQHSNAGQLAEATYRDIVQNLPDNPAALTRFAQVLSRNVTRIEPALDVWQRIAENDPAAPFPLVQRAQLLERARRPQEAESEYLAALARAPRDEAALFGLARLLVDQSRWAAALERYRTLHAVRPRRTDVLLGIGRCLERLDQPNEALAAYGKVLELDAANANGLLYRGRLLRQLGRSEEAIRTWQEICRRTPRNADAWYELIFMLATAERDAEALAALDDAQAALPATPASWVRLGLAAQAGQFNDQAVSFFERAIAAEPQDASHRARLGQHYLRRGILDGAFQQLLAARELKPKDTAITRQLVETLHGLNAIGVDHIGLQRGPQRCGELLVPEGLFERVRALGDEEIVPYVPVPRRVIAVSSSLAGGGAERQLVNVLRGLSDPALGLEVALFCISLARRNRRDFFLPLLEGTPVEIVTPDDAALEAYLADPDVAPYSRLVRAFPPDMTLPIAFWLGEFRRRRPQVVHAWQDATNLTAVVAALLAGVPRIILAARSVRPDNPRRRLKRFMREGYRAVLGHPSVVLSNNSLAGARDYAEWLAIDPAGVEVIYNGIDFEQLAEAVDDDRIRQARAALGIPPDAPVIGSAFRMSEEKRPLLWVEAVAEVARHDGRAHFVVYGDGPMRSDMLDLARQRGIADRLHLPGPEDDIASCYKAMNVVMLTSRHEGLPNVLLEAQSLGIPVVAPDVGGVSEAMLPGITGWAVADAEAATLADRVCFCLQNQDWADRARKEAPAFVRERFGIPAMLRRTLEVYGL